MYCPSRIRPGEPPKQAPFHNKFRWPEAYSAVCVHFNDDDVSISGKNRVVLYGNVHEPGPCGYHIHNGRLSEIVRQITEHVNSIIYMQKTLRTAIMFDASIFQQCFSVLKGVTS